MNTVSHYVKDTFWKQITTMYPLNSSFITLCLTMSKIHSESKSQQLAIKPWMVDYCVSLCQRYILKANHNRVLPYCEWCKLCLTMSKIHSESKSQQAAQTATISTYCVSLCQRYILKANHNYFTNTNWKYGTVSHYVKDTFWKQITTGYDDKLVCVALCLTMSKIHSESKSQQKMNHLIYCEHCVSLCQRYILKANHNSISAAIPARETVSHYVKDTFWKQITTVVD